MSAALRELGPPPPLYIGDVAETAAARHPDVTITTDHEPATLPGRSDPSSSWTTAEVAAAVDRWAARLRGAGVSPGDHVMVWLPSSFDIVVLAWSIARAGAVPVLVSSHLDPATVDVLLGRLTEPILLTRAERAAALDAPGVRQVLVLGDTPVGTNPGGSTGMVDLAAIEPAASFRPVHLHPEEPALITHTSGTTGVPKLIVNTAASLGARLRPQERLSHLVRRPEPMLVSVAFVHSRSYTGLTVALGRGWPLIVVTDPAPATAAAVLATHRPAIVEAPPNVLMSWEELKDHPSRPLATVRYYSSTFDAAHARTMRTLLGASRRTAPVFVALYGQSETGPVSWRLFSRRGLARADPRCLGHAWPGSTHVRVMPREGGAATRERPGHLEVATRGRLQTYLGEHQRFLHNVDGRWWRLGDMGHRTWRGCIHLADREVDQVSGLPSTLDIEDLLFERLPDLTEVVVVDDDGRPRPVITTSSDRPIDPETWATATTDVPLLLAPIHLSTHELPRTATWKTRRVELVERLRRGELGGDR